MKVLVASFTSESNAAVKSLCTIDQYVIKYGKDILSEHGLTGLFENEGIEPIPVFFADGHANGLVDPDAFEFIFDQIIKDVKEHIDEIDGIYFHLHGASSVNNLPESSADLVILREVRKLVGKYLPIAVVMDPHGNVNEEFCGYANIVRSYRESPHTDKIACHQLVAHKLVELMKNRAEHGHITPVIHKLPIMLGGERCVSTDEPLRTINQKLDELEEDAKIFSASYHIGYLRHDDDMAGAAVVIVPNTPNDKKYCQQKCDELAKWVWDHRKDFHFTGNAEEPEIALRKVIDAKGFSVLTDSGDNMTSGARGHNTYVLRQVMELKDYNNKKILFAPIVDSKAHDIIKNSKIGDRVEFDLGINTHDLTKSVHISGVIEKIGLHVNRYQKIGIENAVTVKVDDKPISIIVCGKSVYYVDFDQFEASNINVKDYDIVIVKQGYVFPDLKSIADYYVMSLTDGTTNQRAERLTYRRIHRPMYPIDNI